MTRPVLLAVLALLAGCEVEAGAWNLSQDFGALEGAAGPVDVWVGPGIDVGATHEAVAWLNETAGAECFAVVEQAWPWPERELYEMPEGAISLDVREGLARDTGRAGSAAWPRAFAGEILIDAGRPPADNAPVIAHELLHIAYGDGEHAEHGMYSEGGADHLELPAAYVDRLRAACASRQ